MRKDNNKGEEIKEEEVNGKDGGSGSGTGGSGRHDVLWAAAAKINTFNRAGIPFPTSALTPDGHGNCTWLDTYVPGWNTDGHFTDDDNRTFIAPGVMVYDWIPTLGVADSRVSSVNMAFKALYSAYRKANTGSANQIQAPDLAAYVLAMESAYSAYYAGVRILGLVNQYLTHNAYSPRVYVEALGFDYDDIIMNQPQLISFLNLIGRKLSAFYLPAAMPALSDHLLMNTVLFTDGEDEKSQRYVFRQKVYLSYEVADQAKGLKPIIVEGHGTLLKFADYVALINRLVDALMTSSDISLISGGFERLFGDAGKYPVLLPDYEYSTPTMKSETMLAAINNAVIVPVDVTGSLSGVPYLIADTGEEYFTCKPTYYVNDLTSSNMVPSEASDIIGNPDIANFVSADPSPEFVAEAMRFHPLLKTSVYPTERDSDWKVFCCGEVLACGSEILVDAVMYTMSDAPKGYSLARVPTFMAMVQATDTEYPEATTDMTTYAAMASNIMRRLALLSNFDWHHPVYTPRISIINNPGSNGFSLTITDSGMANCDYQNAAPLSGDVLRQIHETRAYINYFTF